MLIVEWIPQSRGWVTPGAWDDTPGAMEGHHGGTVQGSLYLRMDGSLVASLVCCLAVELSHA